MDDLTYKQTPKEALSNLVKSMQGPLIWMGVGAIITIVVQSRFKKRSA